MLQATRFIVAVLISALAIGSAAEAADSKAKPASAKEAGKEERIRAGAAEAAQAFQAGDVQRSVALFRELVQLDPGNALAWHFLGQSLEKTGDSIGARRAYRRALEIAPVGEVADRTRALMARMPQPDPATIALPSGLMLLDWMTISEQRISSGEGLALLPDIVRYIDDYGAYPRLVAMRDGIVATELKQVRLISPETAAAALPRIQKLKKLAGERTDLLQLEATALHIKGDFTAAQSAYTAWLRLLPGNDHQRPIIVARLLKAQKGEALIVAKERPLFPYPVAPEVLDKIESSEAFAAWPKVASLRAKEVRDTNQTGETKEKRRVMTEIEIEDAGGGYLRFNLHQEERRTPPLDGNKQNKKGSLWAKSAIGYAVLGGMIDTGSSNKSLMVDCDRGLGCLSMPFPPFDSEYNYEIKTEEISGSLYPPRIGAAMKVRYHSASSANRDAITRVEKQCRITGEQLASSLHPKLPGKAWTAECTRITYYPWSKDSKPSTSIITDYLIEDLGLMLSSFSAADVETLGKAPDIKTKVRYFLPEPGYSKNKTEQNQEISFPVAEFELR